MRGVEAFEKLPGVACSFAGPSGCGRYDTRPAECAEYFCAWRVGFLPEESRPDRSAVVIDFQADRTVTVRPSERAEPWEIVKALEAAEAAFPHARVGLVPFALPPGALFESMLPGTREWRQLLERVAAGRGIGRR